GKAVFRPCADIAVPEDLMPHGRAPTILPQRFEPLLAQQIVDNGDLRRLGSPTRRDFAAGSVRIDGAAGDAAALFEAEHRSAGAAVVALPLVVLHLVRQRLALAGARAPNQLSVTPEPREALG